MSTDKKESRILEKSLEKSAMIIRYSPEKLKAIRQFAKQKNVDLELKSTEFLDRMFKEIVPKGVRDYLEIEEE